ncbi:MAG: hypothetical protein HYV38_01450 [Candidatus Levybacteria bacterium]|nr:hypothetical protein [Candidatus Levybacteria bacterium]
MLIKINKSRVLPLFIQVASLIFLYFILYKLFMPRILAFGCFDDCFAISSGNFLNEGKGLYSDIFYNHQLLLPYLSSWIQNFFNPINVFELILRHRQVMLLLSFVFNLILILRFRAIALLFAIFYETSKFYFFGDRFLAETLIIYPIIYMALLCIQKIRNIPVKNFDYLIVGVFVWFTFFMREPYVPLILFLYLILLIGKGGAKFKIISVLITSLLTLITLTLVNINDMYYALYTFNQQAIINQEYASSNLLGLGILRIFLYPVIVFIQGETNFMRYYLIGAVGILLASVFYYFQKFKDLKLPVFIFISLGLAAIRFVNPGQIFYEAYRQLIWNGLLIISILSLAFLFKEKNRKLSFLILSFFSIFWLYLLINKDSYIFSRADPQFDVVTYYGRYMEIGSVVKDISDKDDTFFADGAEELLYWSTGLKSSYKYSMYTAQMPSLEKFRKERDAMFLKSPPDFYYYFCKTDKSPAYHLEKKYRKEYTQLLSTEGKPSCLFVHKNKLQAISQEKRSKIEEWGYKFPSNI